MTSALNRAITIIQSCILKEQLEVAKIYARLAWMDTYYNKGADKEFGLTWAYILQREINDKEKELALPEEFR